MSSGDARRWGLVTDLLAESVVAELQQPHEELPSDPDTEVPMVGDDPLDNDRPYVFSNQIRFAIEPDEFLSRIQAVADERFQEMFAAAIILIDQFYLSMRMPRLHDGHPLKDSHGRMAWETDPDTGRPIERLDRLTGQDFDQLILSLEEILLEISPLVNKMRLDALYYQNIAKDAHDDFWPSSGTQADRIAKASKDSRQDRWVAFFHYYVFSSCNSFQNEIRSFIRKVDNIRYRQMQS